MFTPSELWGARSPTPPSLRQGPPPPNHAAGFVTVGRAAEIDGRAELSRTRWQLPPPPSSPMLRSRLSSLPDATPDPAREWSAAASKSAEARCAVRRGRGVTRAPRTLHVDSGPSSSHAANHRRSWAR
ncbi:hypothetical protein BP6252_10285 [Coleophoma cylindrospora]|uniref:Uncharacterized protein n=1 Tax=Coleophoma cylindrospora TaxID=1849047 RepID=A0A3D8QSZ9_9HELO|nr:hypothetical protein BP6252_10285 [Coleophoma cylindrospora]